MKTITFQFVTEDSDLSALIRWKTDSEISHVNLCTPDGFLQGALLEGGIQKRPANYSTFTLQLFVTIPCTDEQYDTFWSYANGRVGEHYNKAGIVGIALGKSITNPADSFCSEYASECIMAAGIFNIAKDVTKVDPELLRMMLMSQAGATETRIESAKGVSA
jgi:hypothetical protein